MKYCDAPVKIVILGWKGISMKIAQGYGVCTDTAVSYHSIRQLFFYSCLVLLLDIYNIWATAACHGVIERVQCLK